MKKNVNNKRSYSYIEVNKLITFNCPKRGVVSEYFMVKVYEPQGVPEAVHIDEELIELLENNSIDIDSDTTL